MLPGTERWIRRHIGRREMKAFAFELEVVLERLLGPLLRFEFRGLKAGYPYLHIPQPGVLYLRYERPGKRRIMLQIIGGEPLPEGAAEERLYRKCMEHYNKLTMEGWAVLGFTREHLQNDCELCESFVSKLFEMVHGIGGDDVQLTEARPPIR